MDPAGLAAQQAAGDFQAVVARRAPAVLRDAEVSRVVVVLQALAVQQDAEALLAAVAFQAPAVQWAAEVSRAVVVFQALAAPPVPAARRGMAAHQAAMAIRQPETRQTQIPQILMREVREDSIPVPQPAIARFSRSETPSRQAQAPNQAITEDIAWSFSPKRWPTASTSPSSGV